MAVVLLVVIVLAVTIWVAFFDDFGKIYKEDIIIESPDGKHQLLICEWGTVGGTGAEIYTINPNLPKFLNRLMKVKVGYTSSDDSCLSFSDGHYDITWADDSVVIYYFSGRKTQDISDKTTWSFVRCKLR